MELIMVGIGGTGAKIVESLIHLAASCNSPETITVLLIDQDENNGNVLRCKSSIKNYAASREKLLRAGQGWAFKPIVKYYEQLLPLKPDQAQIKFMAAIDMPKMADLEAQIVSALYSSGQLSDSLVDGYKKRAHMGSVLMRKMLNKQRGIPHTELGLNRIIEESKGGDPKQVIICGSLFGGTGSSGIVTVGDFFKEFMPGSTVVKSIMMTPYFRVSESEWAREEDRGVVRSTFDMQILKIALEMFKDDIEIAFHHVYLIGSDLAKIKEDIPTKKNISGGSAQENPSHVFEMLASTAALDKVEQGKTIYHKYAIDAPFRDEQVKDGIIPDIEIDLSFLPDFDFKRLMTIRAFSNLLSKFDNPLNDKWKSKQPWIASGHFADYSILAQWGERHNKWWKEIAGSSPSENSWKHFTCRDELLYSEFEMSSLLSKNMSKRSAETLADSLDALNSLAN